MKRLVALLVAAVALGWGALAINVEDDQAREPTAPEREPAGDLDRPSRDAPTAKPTPKAPEPGTEAERESESDEGTPTALPSLPPGPEVRPVDQEFEALSRAYASEPRDGAWALAHERRMMELSESPEVQRTVHVHCRTTVCRLTVERGSPQDLHDLIAKPGVREATGLHASSPYAFEAGSFTLYYRRTEGGEPSLP